MDFNFQAIGIIHSCFKEKFGIPRQPGLAPLATARLEFFAPYNNPNAFDGLNECSHIWIQFVFHANRNEQSNRAEQWKPKVRPPRLGGNKSRGVFATRSPVRPNPIGLSVVKLERIAHEGDRLWLELSGVDFLDETPVLDIKPYVPYVDCVNEAINDFAAQPPVLLPVELSPSAVNFCTEYSLDKHVPLGELIVQVLQQDPRPQYQQPEPERVYGMRLLDLNIRWRYLNIDDGYQIRVTEITTFSV